MLARPGRTDGLSSIEICTCISCKGAPGLLRRPKGELREEELSPAHRCVLLPATADRWSQVGNYAGSGIHALPYTQSPQAAPIRRSDGSGGYPQIGGSPDLVSRSPAAKKIREGNSPLRRSTKLETETNPRARVDRPLA